MSKYSKHAITALLVILVALVAFPATVLAIADPDTGPQINSVYVYDDLLEEGDVGVLIEYYLDYATNPDETATEAYLAVFIDTDGTTQLKSVAPYTFYDSGYSGGLMWIYFSAAEVSAYSISQANEALYDIWLVGNPTLAWTGDPPQTIASIDYWQTAGDSSALLALRVLYYADRFELAWTQDLVESTALGNRLTTLGEEYFTNVIPDLRTISPSVFSSTSIEPTQEDIDYTTEFGATANGTIVVGSPVTLAEGANTITTTGTGVFTVTLNTNVVGTVEDDVGTVDGSPVDIVAGENLITCTGAGAITVTVNLEDTATVLEDTITGTGFDLTAVATAFGMSREMFSGFVWLLVTVLICAAAYRVSYDRAGAFGSGGYGAGKVVLVIFDVCIIGGVLLGLLHILVAALMFIAFGAFTAYVLFFKGANV